MIQVSDFIMINSSDPMACESFRLPLDSSMPIIFTGYFNGFNIEIRSGDEAALLYHMGCFGKGTKSRSKPRMQQNQGPYIMRMRQYLKRNYWYKKFGGLKDGVESNNFLKKLDELTAKIIKNSSYESVRDVIDLVSSEEECDERSDASEDQTIVGSSDTSDTVVIVPNSDSEEEDYFAKLKPKCCLNKVKIEEKLVLTLEEAFFLLYGLGCLQIIKNDKLLNILQCWDMFLEIDSKFLDKYVVYHYYRSKGYIVKQGIKFGGDYLLYREGPSINHADYIVVIKHADDNFNWVSVLGHVRMAVTTVKEIIVAEVLKSEEFNINTPENLKNCSVREIVLNRNIPVLINEDND